MVGVGNACGDGVYFATDVPTAKSYAGSGGVYLKCRVQLGKTCKWNSKIDAQYNQWCQAKGTIPNNSAKTAFLVQSGYKTVQSGNVIVVLAPQYANPSAWKRKRNNIRVLSVHRASDDKRIRV